MTTKKTWPRIALAQINSLLGNFESNANKISESIVNARNRHCDLVVFPEAALMGYHPVDLLEQPEIVKDQLNQLKVIHQKMPKGIKALVGVITLNPKKLGKPFCNSAVLLEKGKKPVIFSKQLLPTYDVFDEGRHIEQGETKKNFFDLKGKKVLVTICEDIWAWPTPNNPRFQSYGENPLTKIPKSKVDIVVNLSASPFTNEKLKARQFVVRKTAQHFNAPLIYTNLVGAQDELIFDGASYAIDAKGKVLAQAARFEEDFIVLDLAKSQGMKKELNSSHIENLRRTLVLGLSDFVRKTGFEKVHLGISGGIDSALVACLAVDALGASSVKGVLLPGPYTSNQSNDYAFRLCKTLGIEHQSISIEPAFKSFTANLDRELQIKEFGLIHENIQARLRGVTLMAISNKDRSLLLGTSNKSELAVGYSTLYGDLCGALLPIGDLLKEQVYALAAHYNQQTEIIPNEILTRPPTAELRPNQKDEDSLPPYSVLDPIVKKLVEELRPPSTELENKIYRMMLQSEFKRWQSPPVLKVTTHAFGRGRRWPIAAQLNPSQNR